MEQLKDILQIIFSWPGVAIAGLVILRGPIKNIIERFIKSETGKAKVGPIEIELGEIAEKGKEAVNDLNKINHIMAKRGQNSKTGSILTFQQIANPLDQPRHQLLLNYGD